MFKLNFNVITHAPMATQCAYRAIMTMIPRMTYTPHSISKSHHSTHPPVRKLLFITTSVMGYIRRNTYTTQPAPLTAGQKEC